MKEEFQILRYDCRGQGKSEKPESIYELNDHVNDLIQVIDEHQLKNENIILIGLSNGGRIVLSYAAKFKVRAVVALDTYDIVTPMINAKLNSWLQAHLTGGPLHRFDIATPWIWGEEVFNSKSELLLSYREKASSMPSHVVGNLINGALKTDLDLSIIESPVLLIAGEEDLLTPYFNHEKMVKKLKNGYLKKAPGGHASLIERPNIADKIILPWLKENIL